MEKLRIVLCDANKQELEDYGTVCRDICEKSGVPVDFGYYSNCNELLFDMGDHKFSTIVSILIVDPENDFVEIPASIRKNGYNGMIIYLSHSKSLEHYRQAFDVGAYNFVEKGSDPQTLSRFQLVFESALSIIEKKDFNQIQDIPKKPVTRPAIEETISPIWDKLEQILSDYKGKTQSVEARITEQQLKVLSKKHLLIMILDLQEELDRVKEENEKMFTAYQAGIAQRS